MNTSFATSLQQRRFIMCVTKSGWVILAIALCAMSRTSQAAIISIGSGATLYYGYNSDAGGGLDSHTTHYWRFDEGAVTYADTGSSGTPINMTAQSGTAAVDSVLFSAGGATNKGVRIGTNATSANRITAFTATTTTTDNITAAQANSLYGSDGAITIDMLVRPDFDSSQHAGATFRMINEENEEGRPANIFLGYDTQSDVHGGNGDHAIEFSLGGAQVDVTVPFVGPNGLASGSWYHLAVIYTGDENASNNVKFYWTKVSGPADTNIAANLIGTATLAADPVILTDGPEFTFGNETNGASNKGWFGALDAIRISDIDRDPTGSGAGFIFVPEPSAFLLAGINLLGLTSVARRRSKT
jgi:hypothetical protein